MAAKSQLPWNHLRKAVNLYANDYFDDNKKKLPRAFCSHYLGLIDKNWCPVGLDKSVTLEATKRHLQDACELLKADEKELLTPVTLAEVCSYSSRSRATSVAQLGSWESGRLTAHTSVVRNPRSRRTRSRCEFQNVGSATATSSSNSRVHPSGLFFR